MGKVRILEEKELDNKKVRMQTIQEIVKKDLEFTSHKIILPTVSDSELIARYERIKPIVSIEKLYYYLREFNLEGMRRQSYIWYMHEDKRELVDMTNSETLAEFSCYHTYGYYGFFKPSIAEVLQQFPDEVLNDANAFYMFESPETRDDLSKQWDIVNAGCQRSKVRALVLKK